MEKRQEREPSTEELLAEAYRLIEESKRLVAERRRLLEMGREIASGRARYKSR
jgi:hypothetical protein